MELVGEEKRIQALFSELRFEDESFITPFATVWNRANLRTSTRRGQFRLSFVSVMALIACVALFSFLVIRSWRSSQNPVPEVKSNATAPDGRIRITNDPEPKVVVKQDAYQRPNSAKLLSRRHAQLVAATRKAAREAAALSKWQSPTSALLRSPSDEVLTSLPQLDESANELKLFLPRTP